MSTNVILSTTKSAWNFVNCSTRAIKLSCSQGEEEQLLLRQQDIWWLESSQYLGTGGTVSLTDVEAVGSDLLSEVWDLVTLGSPTNAIILDDLRTPVPRPLTDGLIFAKLDDETQSWKQVLRPRMSKKEGYTKLGYLQHKSTPSRANTKNGWRR